MAPATATPQSPPDKALTIYCPSEPAHSSAPPLRFPLPTRSAGKLRTADVSPSAKPSPPRPLHSLSATTCRNVPLLTPFVLSHDWVLSPCPTTAGTESPRVVSRLTDPALPSVGPCFRGRARSLS